MNYSTLSALHAFWRISIFQPTNDFMSWKKGGSSRFPPENPFLLCSSPRLGGPGGLHSEFDISDTRITNTVIMPTKKSIPIKTRANSEFKIALSTVISGSNQKRRPSTTARGMAIIPTPIAPARICIITSSIFLRILSSFSPRAENTRLSQRCWKILVRRKLERVSRGPSSVSFQFSPHHPYLSCQSPFPKCISSPFRGELC